jgi:two-component system LytT family response regulator
LDYLLKPIQKDRLQESLKKVTEKAVRSSSSEQEMVSRLGVEDQVFVKDGDKCWFVKLSDVRLFESEGNYIKVYFDGNRPMIHK